MTEEAGGGGCDVWRMTAAEIAERLASGTLTTEALARACLDRAERRDARLKAWVCLSRYKIIGDARDLDKTQRRGALHGIPIAIKDMIDTRDMPTQYNSPIYRGHRPAADATAVEILRAAGALIFGKTETTEFAAAGHDAPTGNPFDLTRTAGGSSSGSAAAVADCHVPLALGTQTGGSTIRPASFCGIFGFKPTWGSVSREGLRHYSVSLDTLAWFARCVADLELLADVFAIADDAPFVRRPLPGLRIALCRSPAWDAAASETMAALAQAATILKAAGAEVVPLDLPDKFDGLAKAHRVILFTEGGAAFRGLYAAHFEKLHDDFRHRVENRDGFTRADLVAAYDLAAQCRGAFDAIAAPFDAVLTPSAPGEAPKGRRPGDPAFNVMWTLLHVPCVNIPGLTAPSGLPVGVTLTAPRYHDRALLATAGAVAAGFAAAGCGPPRPPMLI